MSELVQEIRARLREGADPERAPGQQAYMKSEMPFLGLRVPEVRRLARALAARHGGEELRAAAEALWDAAVFREERYAAMALLGAKGARGELALLPIIERMVREGQWWDYTDELSHRLAELLDAHPGEMSVVVRQWSRDPNHWIRRIAIISQLDRGPRTDTGLLEDAIAPNVADAEFFIRKGIGWALRQYARTDPAWVQDFARRYELSPLSRREALKHVGPGV